MAAHVAHARSRTRPVALALWRGAVDVVRFSLATLSRYFRVDVTVLVCALVFLALFAPLVTRNTANPQLLAAYANDEPFLTMALEATLVPPFLNPGAYFDPQNEASQDVPKRWGDLRYGNIIYYGGAMFDVAFVPYATLRVLGAPAFPTGPILLRLITLVAALLSLVVLYNIAKDRGSRLVGVLAVGYVATDSYFLYYSNFLHPDTLQMLLGLCVFLLAVAHVRDRTLTSVLALGVFCGFVQGAKSGLGWTLPAAFVAMWLASGVSRRLVKHVVAFGGAVLIGFFVTTPYAFIDTYYERSLRIAFGIVTQNSIHENVTLSSWGHTLYDYIGRTGVILLLLTALRALWHVARRRPDHALTLAVILAASQFLWYGGAGKLWHVPGYLILSFGLMAVFAYETVFAAIRIVGTRLAAWSHRAAVARVVWAAGALVVVVMLTSGRWFVPASWAIDQYTLQHSTIRQANHWAVAHHVSPDASIVYDDLAYFDRGRFPDAHHFGGVLTWTALDQLRPKYIVLSSSLYGADWMQKLIATQHDPRRNADPYNVHLYQDLLPAVKPGATKVRGIVLERILRPESVTEPSRILDLESRCNDLCDLRLVDLRTELALAANLEMRIRVLRGSHGRALAGPVIRVYRVDDPSLFSARA